MLILKIYATLPILVIHVDFEHFYHFKQNTYGINDDGVYKDILARLKMFTMKMGKRVENCLKCKSFEVRGHNF